MKLKTIILIIATLVFAGCSVGYDVSETTPEVIIEMTEETEEVQTKFEKLETTTNAETTYAEPETTKNVETTYEETETSRILTNDLCAGLAKEIFDATNAERQAAGLEPLIWDDELAKYANIRAEEIITTFGHVRPDGTKCYVLSDLIWGENLARGPDASGAEFLAHWIESPSHKENILRPEYRAIGVGTTHTEQGVTAVQLFGIDTAQ